MSRRSRLLFVVLALATRAGYSQTAALDEPQPIEDFGDEIIAPVASTPFGPMRLRQIDSLSTLFYQADADMADTLPRGKWQISTDVHYSEHEVTDYGDDGFHSIHRDFEMLRLELRAEYGITDDLEAEVILPFHYLVFGVLNEFIDDFHAVTGLGPTGELRQEFQDFIEFRDQIVHRGEKNRFRLADTTLSLKYSWLKDRTDDPLGVSFRTSIELPTGSAGDRVGNGKVDGGFGVLTQKTFGDFTLYFSADAQLQQTPDNLKRGGARIDPIIGTAHAAAEWRASSWFALVLQFQYAQRLFGNAHPDVTALADDRLTVALGWHLAVTEALHWRFTFAEDLFSGPSYDVLFHTGLAYRF
ncbi:MAG: DUF3187 family protein [Planctomycetota bacterium]